jgi:antitoxin component YwqK of YwqJK toxin-antitoxin module
MRQGEFHGVSTTWHEKGQKQYETAYQDGKKHGPDESWDMNGELKWSRMHRNGELVER